MTTVETMSGRIAGSAADGVVAFKGIPYAASTAGSGRFRPPRPVAPWPGVRDATEYGPAAAQVGTVGTRRDVFAVRPIGTSMSEDCLVLNVWAPVDAAGLPVLFWIHGGGFNSGSGSSPVFDGSALARRGGIVVVTVNHRLGIFGHLYLESLGGDEYAGSGNTALLDLVAALEWTRDNVAAFGGDPGRVTLCGESSGAGKIGALKALPQAAGLFRAAIMQSGTPSTILEPDDATTATERALRLLGVGVHELRRLTELPVDEVLAVQREVERSATPGNRFGPVFDGVALTPLRDGSTAPRIVSRVPTVIGTNLDEARYLILRAREFRDPGLVIEPGDLRHRVERLVGDRADDLLDVYRSVYPRATTTELLFAVTSGQTRRRTAQFAEQLLEDGTDPVFMYLFTWPTEILDGVLRSCHALEIAFVFDNVTEAPAASAGADPGSVAAQMSSAWAAFTHLSDPGHPAIGPWHPYATAERATMVFGHDGGLELDPLPELRKIWADMPTTSTRRNWSVVI